MALPRSLDRHPDVEARRIELSPDDALAALEAEPVGGRRGTALLLPGYTGSKEDFLPLLPLLAAAGYRAVALDQRGQHESPHAADAEGYSVPRLAQDVLRAVQVLGGGPVHLLGHSFGGLVAREAAMLEPSALASLTLLCSGPGRLPLGRRTDDATLLLATLPGLTLEEAWTVKQQHEAQQGQTQQERGGASEVDAFLERRWLTTDRQNYLAIADTLLTADDTVDALAPLLAQAGVPVLVAHGEDDDAWTPEQQKDMAVRLGARYEVVPDAAHSPAYEAPAATAALLLSHWSGRA